MRNLFTGTESLLFYKRYENFVQSKILTLTAFQSISAHVNIKILYRPKQIDLIRLEKVQKNYILIYFSILTNQRARETTLTIFLLSPVFRFSILSFLPCASVFFLLSILYMFYSYMCIGNIEVFSFAEIFCRLFLKEETFCPSASLISLSLL